MFFAKSKTPSTAEIYIYEDIGEGWFGGLSSKSFSEELRKVSNASYLDIYLNSPGGSVFEGLAIYNSLRRHEARKVVHVDGIAASIASIIMLSGDSVNIAANGTVMIHDPWGFAVGNAQDMRKTADSLEQIRTQLIETYVTRTGNAAEQVAQWMADETWFTAEQALEHKFVNQIVRDKQIENSHVSPLLAKFKNTPRELSQQARSVKVRLAAMDMDLQRIRRASPAK